MGKGETVEQEFGEVLRELRLQMGKTQEVVAFDDDLDRTYISMLECGMRKPSLETVLALARALGVPASEIVAMVETKICR